VSIQQNPVNREFQLSNGFVFGGFHSSVLYRSTIYTQKSQNVDPKPLFSALFLNVADNWLSLFCSVVKCCFRNIWHFVCQISRMFKSSFLVLDVE
jgi:hypothetical protein